MDEFLNTDKLSVLIKRTPGAIRNLVLRGRIPYRKPGGRLLFIKSEIEEWIEESPGKRLEEVKK